ncbi:23S ribosomal RNA methyltransferase Erm [Streptomyces spiramenti]|uniref:23S ribosomal RNA methyltransferase Erm n=1 Tax=Streptomyces spiramenti TaxID=2720606 RepID=UPI003B83021B
MPRERRGGRHALADGRHEFGQNFLVDRGVVEKVVRLVAATSGPVVEIGPGDGALTLPMRRLGRSLTAVELDGVRARELRRRAGPGVTVVEGDFLRHRLPSSPFVLVGNVPFDRTTALLRRVLHADHWTDAVLLVQWEVARRRAGVGGATMMTAQWWPWYDFALVARVPAGAFHPRPGVDGGLLLVERRREPLVPASERVRYQGLVHAVFTGRGRGVRQIVRGACPSLSSAGAAAWARRHRLGDRDLPRTLSAPAWADLHRITSPGSGAAPPRAVGGRAAGTSAQVRRAARGGGARGGDRGDRRR